jgi:hypothetical protein
MTGKSTMPGPPRLLGSDRMVVAFAGASLLGIAVIIFWISAQRSGTFVWDAVSIFYRLFLFDDYHAALLFPVVVLLALMPCVQLAGIRLARLMGESPLQSSLVALVVLAAGALFVYRGHPLAMDEYAPYLQSRIFLAGQVYGQWPPELLDWLIHPNFQNYFVHVSRESGQIMSAYWPGFALLLLPFTALDVPWLCNPVLGALAAWTIHRLVLEITASVEAAGAALLFAFASAAFSINSISFYSMTAHMLCNALFVLLLLRGSQLAALSAGLIGGLALNLHNPVPHTLFALPWLVWLLSGADRRRLIPALALGYLPWVVIVGFGWNYLMQDLHRDASAASGAVGTAASGPIETVLRVAGSVFRWPDENIAYVRLIGLAKVWLWAVPGLILLAALGMWRSRANPALVMLALSAFATVVGYVFVPVTQGHGWGFRYFHSAWFVLPVFAAIACIRPAEVAGGPSGTALVPIGKYMHGAAVASGLMIVPYFAWQVAAFMNAHLAQLPTTDAGTPRVIIVSRSFGYYQQDLVQNHPFLRDPVIVLFSRGKEKDARMLAESFPDLELLERSHLGSVWGYRRP